MRDVENGQSTAEMALALPFVILCLMLVVQVGVIVHDQVMVVHAAREAARAAAVTPDPEAPRRAAEHAGGLDPARIGVRVSGREGVGSMVRTEVRYLAATSVPLIGPLLPEVTLTAAASMRVE